jgi:hypothetical protein
MVHDSAAENAVNLKIVVAVQLQCFLGDPDAGDMEIPGGIFVIGQHEFLNIHNFPSKKHFNRLTNKMQ